MSFPGKLSHTDHLASFIFALPLSNRLHSLLLESVARKYVVEYVVSTICFPLLSGKLLPVKRAGQRRKNRQAQEGNRYGETPQRSAPVAIADKRYAIDSGTDSAGAPGRVADPDRFAPPREEDKHTPSGLVVGFYNDSAGNSHGFIYHNGTYRTVDVPGATSTTISGINDGGTIVGYFLNQAGNTDGFVGTLQ
jgi:hypothetical protein